MTALTVNGAPWTKAWLPASLLVGPNGTTALAFTMSDTPDTTWAASQSAAPPSYPAGPVAPAAGTAGPGPNR